MVNSIVSSVGKGPGQLLVIRFPASVYGLIIESEFDIGQAITKVIRRNGISLLVKYNPPKINGIKDL